jgi:predicted nucleotidyltransferase
VAVAKDKREYVNAIMNEIVYSMKDIFGSKLRQVILFGSYARGEQEEDSDMDIMVLVDLNDSELNQYNNVIAEVITDISIKYGVLPSIIDKNYEHFHHWVPFLPFYRNVKTEGVEFYAS